MQHESLPTTPDHPRPAPDVASATPPAPAVFPVVGLGASAGGLQALQQFFQAMPATSGMAFVVILHLSPDHESHAAQILQQSTAMPVTQVSATVRVTPNHVYVIPPTHSLAMQDGHIVVADPERPNGRLVAVDLFFRTLADTHTTHAACIVLSGTGADGSVGLTRVKETGGIVLVQDPQDAEYDGMPRHTIATGLVDGVLPVAELPQRLLAWWHNAQQIALPPEADPPVVDDSQTMEVALHDVLAVVRTRTGHDFTHYKRATVLRRIERRMQVTTTPTLPAYRDYLRDHGDEARLLLGDLLIGVTNFFRDRHAFDTLDRDVVPLLFEGKTTGDTIRVWVAGCATGEEAYSVAMVLLEHAARLPTPPAIQVFATDIDEAALATARDGSYSAAIEADVSPARLRQFFTTELGGYRVTPALRERVLFARHNVLTDPPFARLDLVTCRNLLIYLNRAAQEQVFAVFHFALRAGGFVFLGSAESVDGAADLFTPIDQKHRVYRAHATRRPPPTLPAAPSTPPAPPRPRLDAPQERRRIAGRELHQQLLDAYAPPSVVVDAQGQIVYVGERAGRFLHLASGDPSLHVLTAVLPELQAALRTALFHALQHGTVTEARRVQLTRDDQPVYVNMLVHPQRDLTTGSRVALVVFAEVTDIMGTEGRAAPGDASDPSMAHLEADVARLHDQLHTTTEHYETTLDALTAANEELQATNEELRAAGEELQTSKEELQSLNEELRTVNDELKHTVTDVSATNDDLRNLIASTDIATIFLDRHVRITRYTPRAQDLFNIIPLDVGRPLADITTKLAYPDLLRDAAEVLRTLQPIEREVASQDQRTYLARVAPYRTTDDHINGVVLTCVDITARTRAEAVLAERARLLDLSNDAIIVRDVHDRIIYWNHGATELYGWTADEAVGQDLHTLLRTEFEAPLAQLVARLQQQDRMEGENVQVTRDGRRIHVACRWALDRDAAGNPGAILTTYNDITARKAAEAALRTSEERLRALLAHLPSGAAFVVDRDLRYVLADGEALYAAGDTPEAYVGKTIFEALPAEVAASYAPLYRQALGGAPFAHEHTLDSRTYVSRGVPLRSATGEIDAVLAVSYDITDRTRAEEALRASEERLRLLLASVQEYAIFTLNTAGQVTTWNEGAHRLKGYTAEEILGQPVAQFYTAEDVAAGKPQHEMDTALRVGVSEDESWRVRKDGSRFWCNEIMTPLYAADGTLGGFTKVSRDLTARKQAEDAVARALVEQQTARTEAEAALQVRDQFLSIASHELRTPLTSLLGYASLLPQVAARGTGQVEQMTERIVRQAQRLNGLIDQLLDVARLQRGQFVVARRPLDLAALVRQVVDEVRVTLPPNSPHTVEVTTPDQPVVIDGDTERLEQVLHNLLSNALKYSPQGGTVRVTVTHTATEACVDVTDEGIGIPPDAQARLFAPFYRAPNVGGQASGFGLGLHIVCEIVQRHGGRIAVDSTEGAGSTFRVVLPLHASEAAQDTGAA